MLFVACSVLVITVQLESTWWPLKLIFKPLGSRDTLFKLQVTATDTFTALIIAHKSHFFAKEEAQYWPFQHRPNVKTLLCGKLLESGW
jgi:hypothetical protein